MADARTVLVVDDDVEIAAITGELLTAEGYLVFCAHSAAAAILCLELAPIDLLLTDIRMPGGSGLSLAHTVASRWPSMGIVLMTGYTSAMGSVRDAPWEVLPKPSRASTIYRALRDAKPQQI